MRSAAKGRPLDLLKSALAERQAKSQKIIAETGQKWVKRGDIVRKEREDYLDNLREEEEKQKAEEEDRLKKFEEHINKNKHNQDEEAERVIPQHILDDALLADDDAEPPVAVPEVIERLRALAQAITLFGETDMVRYRRLRQSERELHEGKKNPDIVMLENVHMGQQMEALTNDLQEEEAEKDNEEEEQDADTSSDDGEGAGPGEDKSDSEDEGAKGGGGGGGGGGDKSDSEDEGDTGEQEKRAAAMQAAAAEAKAAPAAGEMVLSAADVPDVDLTMMDQCDFIRAWARKALKIWEKDLADRPEEDKKTSKVKIEVAAHRQVRRDVRPLQKRLRLYTMNGNLLEKIHIIVTKADERNYRSASEAYLDLSIGKAAWPVGIGCGGDMLMENAIGLHDKFNRMKNVKDNATALNDDVTRKFVQALKRLMTIAQKHWPPDNPSMAA